MNNQIIEALQLFGEDSKKFAYSLFLPSAEEIAKSKKSMEDINRNVSIRKIQNGYEAEILDLDLSFLDSITNKTKKSNIEKMATAIPLALDGGLR